jgi:hypothetical protein
VRELEPWQQVRGEFTERRLNRAAVHRVESVRNVHFKNLQSRVGNQQPLEFPADLLGRTSDADPRFPSMRSLRPLLPPSLCGCPRLHTRPVGGASAGRGARTSVSCEVRRCCRTLGVRRRRTSPPALGRTPPQGFSSGMSLAPASQGPLQGGRLPVAELSTHRTRVPLKRLLSATEGTSTASRR